MVEQPWGYPMGLQIANHVLLVWSRACTSPWFKGAKGDLIQDVVHFLKEPVKRGLVL